MKKILKNKKGITLVALVVTIVILLILAGISISTLTNTGIFEKAKDAKEKSEAEEKQQSEILDSYEKELNKYTSDNLKENIGVKFEKNTELHDKNGAKIIVPAGFAVVNEIVAQVKAEKDSVRRNGGYYIGRYEVGDENKTAVIKADKTPMANIIWSTAYSKAKGIGGGPGATTYLCSSYA